MTPSFHLPKQQQAGIGRWAEFVRRKELLGIELARLGYNEGSDIFIASLDNGTVVCTKGENALDRIAENTHSLATEEQIAQFHATQRKREEEYRKTERENKEREGKGSLTATDLAEALRGVLTDPPAAPARTGRNKVAGD
jgi:hypothetical protein